MITGKMRMARHVNRVRNLNVSQNLGCAEIIWILLEFLDSMNEFLVTIGAVNFAISQIENSKKIRKSFKNSGLKKSRFFSRDMIKFFSFFLFLSSHWFSIENFFFQILKTHSIFRTGNFLALIQKFNYL